MSAPHTGMDNQHERAGFWLDRFCEGVNLNCTLVRECRAFGLHGAQVNVIDGRYGYVRDEVARRHPVAASPSSHGGMGLVHVIALDPATGRLAGGADTGAGGMALMVP